MCRLLLLRNFKHRWRTSARESTRHLCSSCFPLSPPPAISTFDDLFSSRRGRSHYGHRVSKFSLPSLLKKCAFRLDVAQGKTIHAVILQLGLYSDPYIASSLISLYSKCHRLADARHVFAQLPHKDTTLWNSMVAGNLHHHRYQDALRFLSQMQLAGCRPDAHSLALLLKACSNGGLGLRQCEQIHGFLFRNALNHCDAFVLTGLIHVYSRTGRLCRACVVFEGVLDKTPAIWNSMISGFFYNGLLETSLDFFVLMRSEGFEVRSEIASCVLSVCAVLGAVRFGESVHCCVTKLGFELDSFVCTSMITLYGNVGLMEEAYKLFDAVPDKNVPLWNSMLSALFSNSRASEALVVYDRMRALGVDPDSVTMTNVLSSCGMIGRREVGRKVHALLIKMPELTTMAVQSSLISMYMRTGDVNEAVVLFRSVEEWDVVLLSSMMSGFFQNKRYDHALKLFQQLHSEGFIIRDSGFFASIISVCSAMDWLQLGFQIHSLAMKNGTVYDAFLGSALINMYSKCGLPLSAESVFSATERKSLVVWNSLISGYSRNGLLGESIGAFVRIVQSGLIPDSISITSVLISVSTSAALSKGKMIHAYLVRNGVFGDEIVENSLLDMYMKCGCLGYAKQLFDGISSKNIVACNTMIAGYGFHGECSKAIELFQGMQMFNVVPNGTSFLSLISSCSHSGLVAEGCKFYDSMIKDYGIVPGMEHFANMVDLFSRAGYLEEAYRFIREDMPVEPDERIWMCFLSACRVHRVLNLGEIVVEQLIRRRPEETGSYVQVLNLYGEMELMEKSAAIRVGMRAAGLRKTPGCSWIEVADRVGVFYSGDSSSPVEVHAALNGLQRVMKLVEDFKSM
ncbi:Pentatricopeptide repeat-containing protein [Platanthera zijinensis]|uniref:Pentatricopeptide repeat-containing protein n=1 Tax=Platanthera zijinensis TaxID=2320716 RepID=A0AAP0G541_9ASPA